MTGGSSSSEGVPGTWTGFGGCAYADPAYTIKESAQ
jgi:hypothetical protein